VAFGFQAKEAWRLFAAAFIGMVMVLSIEAVDRFWRSGGPPIITVPLPGEQAIVQGTSVTLLVDQTKHRRTCSGAHSDHRALHFPNGHERGTADPVIDGYMPIIGSRIPSLPTNHNIFPLFLALPRPLPNIPGGHWFLDTVVSNNCNILERLVGPETAVETPPIPVKILN
jgi:hypothetical protein